jgi:hypothetical protein
LEAAGFVLLSNEVDQLISAMAPFDGPTAIGGIFGREMEEEVLRVISAIWQAALFGCSRGTPG